MEVGVYGLGRFGYFWSELLSRHCTVKAYSRSEERPSPPGVQRVSEDELLALPVLILCVSISSFEEVMTRIAGRLAPGALVMDTCSVKVHPARVMQRFLPDGIEILATHPMFGPDSARDGTKGLPMVLCPVRVRPDRVDRWSSLFSSLGLDVLTMSPEEHDREAAFTQGITHYVGRVLADLGLSESSMATLGYRKLLEIRAQTCNDPWQLFLDLQRFNPYTKTMRRRLHDSLFRILSQLEGGQPGDELSGDELSGDELPGKAQPGGSA